MIIKSGKKAGKSTEELVLKDPDWVQFFCSKNSESKVTSEFKKHISKFDARRFVTTCYNCKKEATRISLYQGNAQSAICWCDTCDPYSLAASPGKLSIVKTYAEALRFVDLMCKGSRTDKRLLIRDFAQKKGLASRVSQNAAIVFLS